MILVPFLNQPPNFDEDDEDDVEVEDLDAIFLVCDDYKKEPN
jgi:hypothetical protein